jgi:hypothetical protein
MKKIYNKNAREKALLEEAYCDVYRESATSLDNTFAIDSAVSPFEELFRGSWDEIVEYLGPEYEHELMIRKGELGANKFQVSKGDGIELDEFESGRQTEKRDEEGRLIPRFKYFVKRAEPLDPADDHSDLEAYRKARGIEMPSDEENIDGERWSEEYDIKEVTSTEDLVGAEKGDAFLFDKVDEFAQAEGEVIERESDVMKFLSQFGSWKVKDNPNGFIVVKLSNETGLTDAMGRPVQYSGGFMSM